MKGGDIPKELLIEILCRLPSAESACQCKLVSKSWCTLISDPYFIGRFLWIQRKKQTSVLGTVINNYGNALLDTEASFTRRKRSFFCLLERTCPQAQVAATWNDLVLCVNKDHCNYYIGNLRTLHLVSLPPIYGLRYRQLPAVGFICEPYYEEKEDNNADFESDQQEEEEKESKIIIKTNAGYKFKVVRILPPDETDEPCFEFSVQVFSGETGEWRDSVVSCQQGFIFNRLLEAQHGVAANGMLYWNASSGDILGFGPLVNSKRSTTTANNGDDNSCYQFHAIEFHELDGYVPRYRRNDPFTSPYFRLGLNRRRLQLVRYKEGRLLIWELNKQELEQMAVQGGGKLGREHRMSPCNISDQEFLPGIMACIAFDPNELDICYVRIHSLDRVAIYKCNIRTGKQFIMDTVFSAFWNLFQVRLPLWPTPVPIISGKEKDLAAVTNVCYRGSLS